MSHSIKSAKFLEDKERVQWHNETLWQVRQKRDKAASKIAEWEQLREIASGIKNNVMNHLDDYLIQFEEQATKNGIQVHWARDGKEHNEIVHSIINRHQAKNVIKSKSILTEECGLNHYLEEKGFDIIDSDLGERIIQFSKETPSHIVMPAIHLKTGEISELFHQHLGTEKGNEDPDYLTKAARKHLRERFLQAEIAITGVNFAIAETGGFVVCTNEGNADLGAHIAKVHIACMGIEKIIPRFQDLGVFTRLLARSATGQSITNYTSHFRRPRDGQEMHIVLVDNNRTKILLKENFQESLKCIRCGACMNTCPVYRRSGGHSYMATVPGPIGSVLSPQHNIKAHTSLPFASSLCGSCTDVCPVKINLHELLLEARQEVVHSGEDNPLKRGIMLMAIKSFGSPGNYRLAGKLMKIGLKWLPKFVTHNRFNTWTKARELPKVPGKSFKEWYKKERNGNK